MTGINCVQACKRKRVIFGEFFFCYCPELMRVVIGPAVKLESTCTCSGELAEAENTTLCTSPARLSFIIRIGANTFQHILSSSRLPVVSASDIAIPSTPPAELTPRTVSRTIGARLHGLVNSVRVRKTYYYYIMQEYDYHCIKPR